MGSLVNSPFLVFVLSFFVMCLAARLGFFFRRQRNRLEDDAHQDLDLVVTATLTLLGLIIGFSFSMAVSRYDQRKNCEEAEANAIGAEYIRAELLTPVDAARLHGLLKDYLNQRIAFYQTRDGDELQQVDKYTAQLQSEMWSAVRVAAGTQPAPMLALAVSGMNDVLNSEGYTQAAWWNRIPTAAWCLMLVVAVCANLLLGYRSHRSGGRIIRLVALPFVLSIAFFAIADIDSPRRGMILVSPQNLVSLAQSMEGR